MNFFSLSSFLIFCTSLILSILLLLKGKEVGKVLSIFCLAVSLWGFGTYKSSTSDSLQAASFWWQITQISIIFTPVLYYHFVYVYLNLRRKIILVLVYCLGFIFLIFNFLFRNIFLNDLRFVFNQFYWTDWVKDKSPIYLIFYIGFYWILLAFPFYLLLNKYLRSKGFERNQLKYFILGSIIGWLGPHLEFLLIFRIDLYPYANFLLLIYPVLWTYAIVRYRLMDISVAITRTSIFVAVYSLVLGIPFALAFGYQDRLIELFGSYWWIVPLVTSTVLATVGPFIYLYIQKKAEDRLLKEQRAYQNILRNASSGMIRIKDLNKLLNVVVHVITKTVKIKSVAIYLFDKESNNFILQAKRGVPGFVNFEQTIDAGSPLVYELSSIKKPIVAEEAVMKFRDEVGNQALKRFIEQLVKLEAALVVPSFVDDKLIGILLLGEKASRKLYSEDDLVVFSVLANQAALAIENAQFYDEVKRTHEQLFQAEKMATIGTMADGLSHQINNRFHALSLISGDALDLLKTSDLSHCNEEVRSVVHELKSALERIEANVLQGGEVVRGLLKYSKPGDGGFELVDFNEVLNGAVDMVQYKIKFKEIDFIREVPHDLPKLNCNLTQLQEVFFNLIDNAYDAIKEREMTLKEAGYKGRIAISCSHVDGAVAVLISDNGMGVKDLDKRKLFAPFFTTKASSKKGTGLGLYVIDKIVSAHNGKITIDSKHGFGTRFTIILPLSAKS